MRIRESAIYYEKLADIMDELADKISEIRDSLSECDSSYLREKLNAYICLYSQFDDLHYEG